MILSSPSKDMDQDLPVTTTFDAPSHRFEPPTRFDPPNRRARRRPRTTRAAQVDWERVENLYCFVRDRAVERLRSAPDLDTRDRARQSLQAVDAMFAQARRGHHVVEACAVTYFRALAMRDAGHPEFLGTWLGAPSTHAHSA